MDIFEDMRKVFGCNYISDLHFFRDEIHQILSDKKDCFMIYPEKQRQDFHNYIFKNEEDGTAKKAVP